MGLVICLIVVYTMYYIYLEVYSADTNQIKEEEDNEASPCLGGIYVTIPINCGLP